MPPCPGASSAESAGRGRRRAREKPREPCAQRGNHNNGAVSQRPRDYAVPANNRHAYALSPVPWPDLLARPARLGVHRADRVGGGPPLCAPSSDPLGCWQPRLTALGRKAVFPAGHSRLSRGRIHCGCPARPRAERAPVSPSARGRQLLVANLVQDPPGERAGAQVTEDCRAADEREEHAPQRHVPKLRGEHGAQSLGHVDHGVDQHGDL
jgi:hypothetical protein